MLLRYIFKPKKDEVRRDWGRLHNNEFDELHCSLNSIRVMKGRRIKVGKSEGKETLERRRCRGENNIKTNYKKFVGRTKNGFIWLEIGTNEILLSSK
jgi:hypothetical protein